MFLFTLYNPRLTSESVSVSLTADDSSARRVTELKKSYPPDYCLAASTPSQVLTQSREAHLGVNYCTHALKFT